VGAEPALRPLALGEGRRDAEAVEGGDVATVRRVK